MENTHSFYATLTANVFVNDDDFYFISRCFKSHYDINIKMAVELGGWLYGFGIRRAPLKGLDVTDEHRILELSNRQIQLILKSMEMQRTDQASLINLRFHKILSELANSQNSLNKNISGWTTDLKSWEKEFTDTPDMVYNLPKGVSFKPIKK